MQFPIFIELRRSRLLDFLLALLHSAAAVSVFVISLPLLFQLLISVLVSFSAWRTLCRREVYSMQLTAQGSLICCQPDGTQFEAKVLADSTVFRYLVVLRLHKEKVQQVFQQVVLPDQMGAAQFRMLLLWLRWRVRTNAKTNA